MVVWRLRSVLGERSENDPPPFSIQFKIETIPVDEIQQKIAANDPLTSERWGNATPDFNLVETATVHHQLTPFFVVDPNFRPDDFLNKARNAYAMVVEAFAKGDKKFLEFMLSPSLFRVFEQQIDKRVADHETYQITIHNLKTSVITKAALEGTNATLTVDFIAEQSVLHKRADGSVIAGDDGRRETTHDRWVFVKDLKSSDPAWKITKTEDLDG